MLGSGFFSRFLGSEAEDSRLLQAGRKARVGLAAQPGSLRLPRPQRKSKRPFFLLFFSGVCVAPCRGGLRDLSEPQQGQENPETEGRRPAAGQASEEGWGLAGGRPRAGALLQASGRGMNKQADYKLLKIISVLLNIRERIQRSDLYRRITRGGVFFLYLFSPTG